MITVKSLHIYPVKSCRGISLASAEVIATGFRWDRRWMLVNPDGSFLSQRTHPVMATVATRIETDRLVLGAPGRSDLSIDLAEPTRHSRQVAVWDDTCRAVGEGDAAADWFSGLLDTRCELVRQAPTERRLVDPRYAEPNDIVSFSDGFPFLLLSDASVDELNLRLENPVSAARFRANIIVQGCLPHAEDGWKALEIGTVAFRVSKPCARCVVVDTDQHDGSRTTTLLRTLAEYRKADGKILFGQNLLHRDTGTLAIGDPVTIIDEA